MNCCVVWVGVFLLLPASCLLPTAYGLLEYILKKLANFFSSLLFQAVSGVVATGCLPFPLPTSPTKQSPRGRLGTGYRLGTLVRWWTAGIDYRPVPVTDMCVVCVCII